MQTPLQAMIWELWRTSRFDLCLRLVAQLALVLLVYQTADAHNFELIALQGVVMVEMIPLSVFSFSWANHLDSEVQGFSFRLGYTRPVTTRQLVLVPMLFVVATAVGVFLLPALLFSWLLGTTLAYSAIALLIMTMSACCLAAAWAPTSVLQKRLAIAAVAVGFLLAGFAFHAQRATLDPVLFALGAPDYFSLHWYESLICLGITASAVAVTVWSVEGQRHSDRWNWGGKLGGIWNRSRPASKRPPFAGPLRAQAWYEWKRFGAGMLMTGAMAPVVVLISLLALSLIDRRWDRAPSVWLVAIAACPIVYQLIGVDGAIGLRNQQGKTQLSAFDGTRPLRNDQLIMVKLLTVWLFSFAGWLMMCVMAFLHATVAGHWRVWGETVTVLSDALGGLAADGWIAILSHLAMSYISSTSILLALGLWLPLHRKLLAAGVGLFLVHVLLVAWDSDHGWQLLALWRLYAYLIPSVLLVGSLVVLSTAFRARYLGRSFLYCVVPIWLVNLGSSVAIYFKIPNAVSLPAPAILAAVAALVVPLAATAIAPLALAAHRHG